MPIIKRVLYLVMSLCLLVGSSSTITTLAQGQVTVSVDAPSEVATGTDFIAIININNVTNFDAANYDITYNSSILQVTNVTSGLISGTAIPVDIWGNISSSTIRVIQNLPGLSGVSGSGYLSQIYFHVIGSPGNTSQVSLLNGVLSDNAANAIQATWLGDSIHVNTVLNSDFSTSPLEGIAGYTSFIFSDGTTGGTPPYTYQWQFGDSSSSTSQNPAHIYTNAGNYTITLAATDSSLAGTTSTIVKASYVKVFAPLAAGFSTNPLEGVANRTVISFTDTSQGGKSPYTYVWLFGDSSNSTLKDPTHLYTNAGTYDVSLTVTESLSTTNSLTKIGYVKIYKAGDANKDGNVNSLDITKTERIIMLMDVQTPGSDANGDGNVNALDITRTELIIMGS